MSDKPLIIQTPIHLDNGISLQFLSENVELSKEDLERLSGIINSLQMLRPKDPNKNNNPLKALAEQ